MSPVLDQQVREVAQEVLFRLEYVAAHGCEFTSPESARSYISEPVFAWETETPCEAPNYINSLVYIRGVLNYCCNELDRAFTAIREANTFWQHTADRAKKELGVE